MKLITDWRQSWRLWSVRLSAIGAAIFAFLLAAPDQVQEIWSALPPDLQAMIPNRTTIGLIITGAVLAARILRQKGSASEHASPDLHAKAFAELAKRIVAAEVALADMRNSLTPRLTVDHVTGHIAAWADPAKATEGGKPDDSQ